MGMAIYLSLVPVVPWQSEFVVVAWKPQPTRKRDVGEDDVGLHPNGIWIPVDAVSRSAMDLVVEVIVHI